MICALLPCGEHKAVLFAVHPGKNRIAVLGKPVIFIHITDAHAGRSLIQIGIFPNSFCLLLYGIKSIAHFVGKIIQRGTVNISGLVLPSDLETVIEKGERIIAFIVLPGTSELGELSHKLLLVDCHLKDLLFDFG